MKSLLILLALAVTAQAKVLPVNPPGPSVVLSSGSVNAQLNGAGGLTVKYGVTAGSLNVTGPVAISQLSVNSLGVNGPITATSGTFTLTGDNAYSIGASSGMKFLSPRTGITWADGSVSTSAAGMGGGSAGHTIASGTSAGTWTNMPTRKHLAFDSNYFSVNDDGVKDGSFVSLSSTSSPSPFKFVNYNGVSNTVNESYGISGVTKNGTGDYTINFSPAYGGATKYSCSCLAQSAASEYNLLCSNIANLYPPTASAIRFSLNNTATTPVDGYIQVICLDSTQIMSLITTIAGGGETNTYTSSKTFTSTDGVLLTSMTFAGVLKNTGTTPTFKIGDLDQFSRSQIMFAMPSSILRLGWNANDGDPSTVISEGVVVNGDRGVMRIKPERIGLTSAYDTNLYYLRGDWDNFYYRNNPGDYLIYANRASSFTAVGTATKLANERMRINGELAVSSITLTSTGYGIKWADGTISTTAAMGLQIANLITREIPSGTIGGGNDTFTLANMPVAGTENVYVNGILRSVGGSEDYTITSNTIIFNAGAIPLAGSKLVVTYVKQ